MAYFAELDSSNKVLRVVVAGDDDVANNGGSQSAQAADHFKTICPLSANGVKWVETSKTDSFRKQFAGKGHTYDESADVFYGADIYPSWTLDANFDGQPPVARPTTDANPINGQPVIFEWDEANQKWSGFSYDDSIARVNYDWNPSTQAWDQV